MRKTEPYTCLLAVLILLFPVALFVSGWSVSRLDHVLARVHPKVRVAERIYLEDTGAVQETTLDSRSFRDLGTPSDELFAEAEEIRSRFDLGGWLLGAFLALVVFVKLYGLSVRRHRKDHEPDRGACLSCGRCFLSCPKEHQRLKKEPEAIS